jgi:hypothetical protein
MISTLAPRSARTERLLMEQRDYNLLFRWFVGLSMDDRVWDATTFTKNRDRLLEGEVATAFFAEVLAEAKAAGLVSDEHFHGRRHAAGGLGQSERFPSSDRADGWRPAQAPPPRWFARRLDLHLPDGGLQLGPAATIARPAGLTRPRTERLGT